jgi:hypothetical protein
MTLREIGGVGRDFVGDDAVFHVFLVGQAEVFFRCDITKHRGAVPANHRRADGGGDVIVAGRDVGGQRTERIKRGFVTGLELLVHVLFDQVHRHVAGAFDHYLAIVLPGDPGELAQRFQFGKLRFVVCIGNRAGTQAVAE